MQERISFRATDLKYPFRWEERRPMLHERVLFVPGYYDRHHTAWTFPGWQVLFGNQAPVLIEYCSGNGAWVVQRAHAYPDKNWIAVEKKFERVRKIWAKARTLGLENLLIVCGEAEPFTQFYLPEEVIGGIYINFPDPWPKEKHAKNRLFQEPFLSHLSRVTKAGAEALFVTDDARYCAQMIASLQKNGAWTSLLPDPYFVHAWPDYGTSYFDQLWRGKGRNIHYLHFFKQ